MERKIVVPARDTSVTSPKLDAVVGEMGALVLILK